MSIYLANAVPNFLPQTQDTASTTSATPAVISTIAVPRNATYVLQALIVARRTGGSSGSANDGAIYKLVGAFYNDAGTATLVIDGVEFTSEAQTTWGAAFGVSSGNATITVTGSANNNIDWSCIWYGYQVS